MSSDATNLCTLELSEAIVAAHKAAIRCRDDAALALIEPLLRHAGLRLVAEYDRMNEVVPILGQDLATLAGSPPPGAKSSMH